MTTELLAPPAGPAWPWSGRRRAATVLAALAIALAAGIVVAVGTGPMALSPSQVLNLIRAGPAIGAEVANREAASVVWIVRLPRVAMAVLAGAGLAVSGTLLQGVFRNPLADPGLIGVSSAAALAVAAGIVLREGEAGPVTLPVAAFLSGLAVALAVYGLARRGGRVEVTTMLLLGLAVNAIAGSLLGLLTYLADEEALRSIVFWSMGGLGGTTWRAVMGAAPFIALALLAAPRLARALDLFAVGEPEARHLGLEVERVKQRSVLLSALATGAAVAVVGPIGFIGLIIPNMLRLVLGPAHGPLLLGSALGGALLLVGADTVARTVVAPAELPVGLITAMLGGPLFLVLILRMRHTGAWL